MLMLQLCLPLCTGQWGGATCEGAGRGAEGIAAAHIKFCFFGGVNSEHALNCGNMSEMFHLLNRQGHRFDLFSARLIFYINRLVVWSIGQKMVISVFQVHSCLVSQPKRVSLWSHRSKELLEEDY